MPFKYNNAIAFQATPKARAVLQVGRILTPTYDSMCGIQLQPKETYVLTGDCLCRISYFDMNNGPKGYHRLRQIIGNRGEIYYKDF